MEDNKKVFKVGDKVWVASFERHAVEKTCPICFGEKEVVLILGDGSKVKLPCGYCSHILTGPSGKVTEYEYIGEPECMTIDRINIEVTNAKTIYEYQSGSRVLYANKVFSTRGEALRKSSELKAEIEKEENERIEYIKKDRRKSFAWNAGYHLGQVKYHKKQLEYHEKMAVICKEREPKHIEKQ